MEVWLVVDLSHGQKKPIKSIYLCLPSCFKPTKPASCDKWSKKNKKPTAGNIDTFNYLLNFISVVRTYNLPIIIFNT